MSTVREETATRGEQMGIFAAGELHYKRKSDLHKVRQVILLHEDLGLLSETCEREHSV